MTQVSAAMIKDLRGKTGAGMMDCKKALEETEGDIEGAVDWLRTKGLASAAKKAGRVAAEGLVAVVAEGNKGAVVEVNSETDFVARNDQFQAFARTVGGMVLANGNGDLDALQAQNFPGGERNVGEELTHMIATIGENMSLRRAEVLAVDQGVVTSYVHSAAAPGLGRIGVLVALDSAGDQEQLGALAKQVAMHVAAASPQSVSTDDLDPEAVERERAVLTEQARDSGKPEDIIGKMVEGRLRKFYQDVVLSEQTWVIDGESKVAAVMEQAGKDLGAPVKIAGFVKYVIGEGIEKEESDFAAEVAAQASGG
ncbi:MAG: elongation factor Ts [Rhodospirillaceae bacterium]|nr:elongation factor Ts [Rhodospirillaceae bacterium]MBT4046327.1 elongation factor Ts [Rhodospirillaceae bacterium]MBT4690659.1 elongation factor Ts [Rhodospirillaceae bacterium]MBT5080545.1 elongation factor Ts [Rhodospirillaceae bacterium]MBT5526586.1 elongation factor Ts [Rhodospirillaceae bacterium]